MTRFWQQEITYLDDFGLYLTHLLQGHSSWIFLKQQLAGYKAFETTEKQKRPNTETRPLKFSLYCLSSKYYVDPHDPDQFRVLGSTCMSVNLLLSVVRQCQAVGSILFHVVNKSNDWFGQSSDSPRKHRIVGPCVVWLGRVQFLPSALSNSIVAISIWHRNRAPNKSFVSTNFGFEANFAAGTILSLSACLRPPTPTQFLF